MAVRQSNSGRSMEETYDEEMDFLISQSLEFSGNYTGGSQIPPEVQSNRGSGYGSIRAERSSTLITLADYDQFSVHTTCPNCNEETDTVLRHHTGSVTWTCCALLVLLTCGLLSWIPFCVNDFKDVDHVCQHCGKTIGSYKRRFISR